MAPHGFRSFASRALAAVLGVGLALVGFELLLAILGLGERGEDAWRVQGLHRPDPRLIYAPIPGARRTVRRAGRVEEVRLDSRGLRGDEPRPRDEVGRRILVLGDSMTFGHGVAEEEAFPAVLETRLESAGETLPVEVVNAGVKGYGTDQIFRLFVERLIDLSPDVVVWAAYVNDGFDDVRRPLYRLEEGELVPLDATKDPLYRLGRANERLPAPLRRTRTARWLLARLARDGELSAADVERLLPLAQARTARQLEALARLGDERGFRFVVVALPWRGGAEDAYAWMTRSLPEGIEWIDLNADATWRADENAWFLPGDYHLAPRGHAFVAERLAELLVDE